MNKFLILLMLLLVALQFAVPTHMIKSREKVLSKGELFRFKTQPIDPADPFQGRYVQLGFQQTIIPISDGAKEELMYNEPVYVMIEEDDQGFARFTSWSREQPLSGSYLKTRYQYEAREWDGEARIHVTTGYRVDIPFDRFYMDEKKAPVAERLVRGRETSTNCWADVRILNGKAVLEDLKLNGVSMRDAVAK